MIVIEAVLGTGIGSWGALLVGLGGILLLWAAVSSGRNPLEGVTWKGTLSTPTARAASGLQLVGSVLVAIGSAFLLINASHLTAIAVIALLVAATAAVCLVMALRLKAHLDAVAADGKGKKRSLVWCVAHPWWRPESDAGPVVNMQDGIDGGEL